MNELEIIQHRRVPGLTVFLNSVDYRTAHMHQEWEVIWVLDEPLRIICGPEDTVLEPGQLVVFAPDEPHEFRKLDQNSTFLCVQLSPAVVPLRGPLMLLDRFPHRKMTAAELTERKRELLAVARSYYLEEPFYEMKCQGKALLAFRELLRTLPTKPMTREELAHRESRSGRLKRLMDFVDANYAHKILLRDFAAQEACSVSYLSRFIRENMNQTFQEYVTSVRFHRACQLIAGGNRKMLDVCMASGFSDYRYFTRTFRAYTGMSPESYARQGQRPAEERKQSVHSLHSRERIFTGEESLMILDTIVL